MKRFFLALLFVVGLAAETYAATYYVDACTNNLTTYNAATRSCTTGAARVYSSIPNACAGGLLTAGDIVDIRAGTYTGGIRSATSCTQSGINLGSGAITFQGHTGETVSLGATASGTVVLENVSNIIIKDLILDGAPCGATCTSNNFELIWIGSTVDAASAGHHIRFQNVELKNCYSNCSQWNHFSHHVEFSGGSAHDVQLSGAYIFYVSGQDNLIEYADIYNVDAYPIHNYYTGGNASRNVYRYNKVHDGCRAITTCSGIVAGAGDGVQIYGNTVYSITGTGNGLISGIHTGNGATNAKIYNNTVDASKFAAISWDNSTSGAIVKNNALNSNTRDFYNSSLDTSASPPGSTISNNRCDASDSRCATTASPGFVDAAGHNYSLAAGSAMINAGIAAIATGITACANGSAPDIGAIETLGTPTATVNGTALVITVPNNCTSQMLPATGVTGFTAKKNGSGNTITANVLSGTNSYAATLTSAFVGGDTLLFSYSQTGNATSNNNIGSATTSNQEILAFTDVAGVNITAGAGGTVGLSHWRVYLLQGATDTAWTAKCAEDSTNCTVAPGSKLWVRFKLRNNSGSNYSPFNFVPRWRYNGGSYVTLTNANYVNAIKVVGTSTQLGTVLSDSTTLTQDQLTSNQTNIACQAIRSSGAFPSLTLNDATETECAQAVDISTAATPGDTYEGCPYDDIGTALTCSTPVKLTVGSYASAR